VERLAARYGISLRYTDRSEGEGRRRRARLVDTMARAVEWYHQRLLSAPDAGPARRYLRERGIDGDGVREFRLGWAPDSWDALVRALRLDRELAEGTGLARYSRGRLHDHFRARVMFPIYDDRGDPVSFGGRILPGGERQGNRGKYVNTAETPLYNKSKVLYGLDRAKTSIVSSGTAVVCAGYTDVIAFHRAGVPLAVATCGTALTGAPARLRRRVGGQRQGLAFDADGAGPAAAERYYAWGRQHELEVEVADLPAGHDPADVARTAPERLAAAVEGATPFLLFRLERVFADADLSSNEGRARAAERALAIVAEHPDDLVRDQYLLDVASRCRIDEDRLRATLDRLRSQPAATRTARGRRSGAGGRGGGRADLGAAPRAEEPPLEEPPWLSGSSSRGGGGAQAGRPDGGVPVPGAAADRAGGRGAAARRVARAREGPATEVLRHAVHNPVEVAPWLVEALFDDPVQREVYLALLENDTHADALAAAGPEAQDLLARLLVEEPTSEPFDAVRLLLMHVARREVAAVRLAARTEPDAARVLADLAELNRIIDELRSAQTAAESADRLLAWLED